MHWLYRVYADVTPAFPQLLHCRLLCAIFSAVFQQAVTMSLQGWYRVTDASTML